MNEITVNIHDIGRDDFIGSGYAEQKTESDNILCMTTVRAIHSVGYNIRKPVISYVSLKDRYRLPFRIDFSFMLDFPEMLILTGNGHICFGSPFADNRCIEDIIKPSGKPKIYNNSIRLGEYNDVYIIYGLHEMRIGINGELRYLSYREPYMKAEEFDVRNNSGLGLGFTCSKRSELCIRSLRITEYPDTYVFPAAEQQVLKPDTKNESVEKPTFESCISALPVDIKDEISNTANALKALDTLKFRRVIEKHGNKITYVVSDFGISYSIYLSGNVMHHSIQWYIITNCKPESWHRKADMMEETLAEIRKLDKALADRLFYALNECTGCCGTRCLVKTPYTYDGQTKPVCHGTIFLRMHPSDFADARAFFIYLNSLVKRNLIGPPNVPK